MYTDAINAAFRSKMKRGSADFWADISYGESGWAANVGDSDGLFMTAGPYDSPKAAMKDVREAFSRARKKRRGPGRIIIQTQPHEPELPKGSPFRRAPNPGASISDLVNKLKF